MKTQNDRLEKVKKMLVIPEGLREGVQTVCEKGTSVHLGDTKPNVKLALNFSWPGCYQDIEKYVSSCDQCQKTGYHSLMNPCHRIECKIKEWLPALCVGAVEEWGSFPSLALLTLNSGSPKNGENSPADLVF